MITGCIVAIPQNTDRGIYLTVLVGSFLVTNCTDVFYSGKQVQNNFAVTCGPHCVFFLCHVQKGMPYTQLLNMYGFNLVCCDVLVCLFVYKISPVTCQGHNFTCVQNGKQICNSMINVV